MVIKMDGRRNTMFSSCLTSSYHMISPIRWRYLRMSCRSSSSRTIKQSWQESSLYKRPRSIIPEEPKQDLLPGYCRDLVQAAISNKLTRQKMPLNTTQLLTGSTGLRSEMHYRSGEEAEEGPYVGRILTDNHSMTHSARLCVTQKISE